MQELVLKVAVIALHVDGAVVDDEDVALSQSTLLDEVTDEGHKD